MIRPEKTSPPSASAGGDGREQTSSAAGPAGPGEPVALGGVLRGMGFVLMLALAMAIVAAVVLVPPYARLQQEKYRRDCDAVRLAEARATVAAMDRMLAEAPSDEVLTKRLAWSRLGLYPAGEQVARSPGQGPPGRAPGTLSDIHYPDPPPPAPWLLALAEELTDPARRRGLMVLAGCLALAAVLMLTRRRPSRA